MIEEKDKDFSIYEVPMSLVEHGLDDLIVRKLGLTAGDLNLDKWHDLLDRLRNPQHEVTIAVVGKYTEHRDAYKSIYEALDHAGVAHRAQIRIQRLHSEADRARRRRAAAGRRRRRARAGRLRRTRHRGQGRRHPLCPRSGAFPSSASAWACSARWSNSPATCSGLEEANSTEFDKNNPHPVICLLEEQKGVTEKGGTMRLGAQPARLRRGSKAAECYGTRGDFRAAPPPLRVQQRLSRSSSRRRRHVARGPSPDGTLVEVVEIPAHPWFVAVQYHPEFKSQPTRPHPLFAGFIGAAVAHRVARKEEALV